MNVFAYVGTNRQSNSNTLKLLHIVLDELQKQLPNEVFNINNHSAHSLRINSCQGCLNCFLQGTCSVDATDEFNKIKNELLAADIVILGSPVYAGTVSGEMKTFIDRLSYWLHLMPLAGKIGIMLITASSNSVMETGNYLHRIMETLGLSVICDILCTTDAPKMLTNPRFRDVSIPQYMSVLTKSIRSRVLSASSYQNAYYRKMKESLDLSSDSQNAESKYWKEKNMLRYQSFDEYLTYIRTEK